MRAAWLIALSFLVLFMATPALAVKVNTLYKATVPVTTQNPAERSKAEQQALIQVLIKISGNTQILGNQKIKDHLNSADTLVQEVGYLTPPPGQRTSPYFLEVQFDPAGINQLLRDAGAASWGQNRPLMIAWIVNETPGKPAEIMSSDSVNSISALLKQEAEQRGLPIIYPLMDMTDLNQASAKDVIDMGTSNLTNAAKRYASDAILIGHITPAANGLASQWKLVLGDSQWSWNLTGKTMAEIAPALINTLADTLAARFAVVTTNNVQKDLLLKVTGITHYPDFAQLTRYLNHLTPVANVEIVKIMTDNAVVLKISLRSTEEAFTQALSLGKKLTPAPTANTTDTMVVYQWNP